MSQTRQYDVAIIGGGVIGLALALHLLDAGRSVLVLEQGGVGSGASHGNCGTITPSHALPLSLPGMIGQALRWMAARDAPFYVQPRLDFELLSWLLGFARRCNWETARRVGRARAELLTHSRLWLAELIAREQIACEFVESGLLTVFGSQQAFDRSRYLERELPAIGIAIEAWTPAQVQAAEPALKPGLVAGHWYPGDARLRPDRFVVALAERVRGRGGEIREQARVDRFQQAGDGLAAVVAGQTIVASQIVLCAGSWSPGLTRALGLRIPLQPGKGYSITYSRPGLCPTLPLVLREPSVCVTSWGSGYRLGSTMEFAGFDASLNRVRLDALVRGARRFLIEPEGPARIEEWGGWRPMSVDELPIIGASSRFANLHYATGHGMLGVSMAVATGRLLAAALCGRVPELDLGPYAPRRFGL
ncbi:MAG: NAD(P)/FAD-dependent oxidoreductase [Porticoccaceae bacterium]